MISFFTLVEVVALAIAGTFGPVVLICLIENACEAHAERRKATLVDEEVKP